MMNISLDCQRREFIEEMANSIARSYVVRRGAQCEKGRGKGRKEQGTYRGTDERAGAAEACLKGASGATDSGDLAVILYEVQSTADRA